MAKVVNLLSPAQCTKLLQIPDDFPEREVVRYYSLSPEDLDIIAEHRRAQSSGICGTIGVSALSRASLKSRGTYPSHHSDLPSTPD